MNELPINLQNRFNLYLNVLPILDKILLVFCFVIGIICLAMANIRAALRMSTSVSEQQKLSQGKNQSSSKSNKSAIYLPCEESFIDKKLENDNEMFQIGIQDGNGYILDKEPALVMDSDDDNDSLIQMKCDKSDEQV